MSKLLGALIVLMAGVGSVFVPAAVLKYLEVTSFEAHIPILIAGYILSALLGAIIHFGKLLQSPASRGALQRDGRPVTLWLRSFATEKIRLDSPHSSKILDHHSLFLSIVPTKLEHALVDLLSPYTAVLAIDGPQTKRYSLGAFRESATEDNWKSRVLDNASKAELVVISLGSSPSLLWETQEVQKSVSKQRVLFLLPPFKIRKKQEWQAVWNELLTRETILPKIPYREIQERRICGFSFDQSSAVDELIAKNNRTSSYLAAIQTFLSTRFSETGDRARNIKRHSYNAWRYLLVIFVVALISGSATSDLERLPLVITNLVCYSLSWYNLIQAIRTPAAVRGLYIMSIYLAAALHCILLSLLGFSLSLAFRHM